MCFLNITLTLPVISIYFDVGKCKESESKDEPALKKSKRNLPV